MLATLTMFDSQRAIYSGPVNSKTYLLIISQYMCIKSSRDVFYDSPVVTAITIRLVIDFCFVNSVALNPRGMMSTYTNPYIPTKKQ